MSIKSTSIPFQLHWCDLVKSKSPQIQLGSEEECDRLIPRTASGLVARTVSLLALAFKTAHAAMLVLSKPTATPYGPIQAPPGQGTVTDAVPRGRANILYWAKALFKLADDFVAKRLAKAPEPPPFSIPSIRFVHAGLAFRYPANSVKVWTLSVDYVAQFLAFTHWQHVLCVKTKGHMSLSIVRF